MKNVIWKKQAKKKKKEEKRKCKQIIQVRVGITSQRGGKPKTCRIMAI